MKAIEIKNDQKNLWNAFIAENNPECFLQSWEWGEFQHSLGRKMWRVAIIEDGLFIDKEAENAKCPRRTSLRDRQIPNTKKISDSKSQTNSEFQMSAIALVVKHNLPFGMNYLYCPRGPVIDKSKVQSPRSKVMEFLLNEIEEIAKKEKSLFLRVDPPIAQNMEHGTWNIYNDTFEKSPAEIQPKDTLMLDLTKSEEELLAGMKQKTRYNINLASRKGVKVINYEPCLSAGKLQITNHERFKKGFDEFWRLTRETSRRDNFKSHNIDYYRKMLETLHADNMDNARVFAGGINSAVLTAKLYLAEYNDRIIAANIVLFFGDIAVYLHGASSDEYRNVMAPYLLQWRQILDAKNAGYKKYDFWGITIDNEKEKWRGITRFKKGFGGREKSYTGAYDFVFDGLKYGLYKKAKNLISLAGKVKR